jgi:hypothetical protein
LLAPGGCQGLTAPGQTCRLVLQLVRLAIPLLHNAVLVAVKGLMPSAVAVGACTCAGSLHQGSSSSSSNGLMWKIRLEMQTCHS